MNSCYPKIPYPTCATTSEIEGCREALRTPARASLRDSLSLGGYPSARRALRAWLTGDEPPEQPPAASSENIQRRQDVRSPPSGFLRINPRTGIAKLKSMLNHPLTRLGRHHAARTNRVPISRVANHAHRLRPQGIFREKD